MRAARLPEVAKACAIRSAPVMGRARYLLLLGALVAAACGESAADPRGAQITRFQLTAPGGGKLTQIAVRPARAPQRPPLLVLLHGRTDDERGPRSEEHTSELQSRPYLACRLLLDIS